MRTLWNPSTGARRHEFGVDDAFTSLWESVGFHLAPGDEVACEIAERRAVVWTRFNSIDEMREWTAPR